MGTLTVGKIDTPSATDDLIITTGNTTGPKISISSANDNIYIDGTITPAITETVGPLAFDQANTNQTYAANTVMLVANTAYDKANTANSTADANQTYAANVVMLVANTAYGAGNTNYTYAANTVMLAANTAYAAGNTNYTYAANVVMLVANTAYGQANTNQTYAANVVMLAANTAYGQANTNQTYAANVVMLAANTAYGQANTNQTYAANNVMLAANSAYTQANDALYIANTKTTWIENPTDSEDITLFYTRKDITIGSCLSVLEGHNSPNLTYSLRYSSDRSASGTEIKTGGYVTDNTTYGQSNTDFDSASITAPAWIWLTTTELNGNVNSVSLMVSF
jgi:hypothetical protein